ncbi:CPBP family intramembrane glutamic endopeptidase [Cellulomonas aerilata]|uniref:CAAX amino protease n=1 Tax=Cellulomonas aerilata TaxID=515326 RepID=A0A512DA41_9CELL|nr:type II CAAX endopeptidase family protein [Cellulomonas aerilata]GEO33247.1 CAAX amino protease [Cellulomonas aerilata]
MVTHDTPSGRLLRPVRAHPVTAFLVWFFTVGQAVAFAPVVLAANGVDVPVQPFIVASTLVGLLLPALVLTRLVDGPDALRALWRRAVDVRVGLGWYVLAVVGVPAVTLGIAVALLGPPTGTVPALGGLLVGSFLLPLALTLLPNNLWEEVAWAGFVQTRLQARRGPVVAAVLTGVLFALQHVSLVVGSGPAAGAVLLAVLAVLAVPFRALIGWVLNRTGSLFLVGLIHATGNAAATGSGFGPGLLGRLYPGDTTATTAHLLAFLVLGLVVLVATRGRLGAPRPATASPRPATVADPSSLGSSAAAR